MTGLSFDLTEEQEQLRQAVRDFADRECPKDVARRLEAAKDFPEDLMQRYWRDARLYRIGPITNEMARNYIGESLGLPRSF